MSWDWEVPIETLVREGKLVEATEMVYDLHNKLIPLTWLKGEDEWLIPEQPDLLDMDLIREVAEMRFEYGWI
jgi:hypothetical protein